MDKGEAKVRKGSLMGSWLLHHFTSIMPASNSIKSTSTRNVRDVVLGEKLFPTWYASFYPTELVGPECAVLYVCPQCFRYSNDSRPYLVHLV